MPNACAIATTGTTASAAISQPTSADSNSAIRLSSPTFAIAEITTHATRPITTTITTEPIDTRRRCSSFGTSTPAAPAAWVRRSSSFQVAWPNARRVDRLRAAGCRYGRTAATASASSAACAAKAARLGSDRQRGRDEELRAIGLQRHRARRDRRAAEIGERGRPVGADHDGVGVELAVRDPSGEESFVELPDPAERRVVDIAGAERRQRPRIAGLDHEHRVAAVSETCGDDRLHRDLLALCEQGDEGFMLDLLEAAAEPGRLAAGPHRRPQRRQQLSVPGVAPVDLHEDRSTVAIATEHDRDAARAERGVPEVRPHDAEIAQRDAHLVEREASTGRAEQQVRERGGADANREPRDDAGGHGDPECEARKRAADEHGSAHPAKGAGHVRRRRHHDGRHHGEPHRGIARRRGRRRDPTEAVGARDPREGRRRHPEQESQAGGEELADEHPCALAGDDRDDDQHGRPDEQQVVRDLPEPPEQTGQRRDELLRRAVELPRAGRDERHQSDHERREHEEDEIGWPAGARRVARRGEDADVGVAERSEQRAARLRGPSVRRVRALGGRGRSIHRSESVCPKRRRGVGTRTQPGGMMGRRRSPAPRWEEPR